VCGWPEVTSQRDIQVSRGAVQEEKTGEIKVQPYRHESS
jgi:hypothetical protein